MDIIFKNDKMKKFCEDHKKLSKKYGLQQAEKITQRLNELTSAENLYDISKLPQARPHPLVDNLKGCIAVDLKHPYRMILLPCNGDPSDWKTITSMKIVDICRDYH